LPKPAASMPATRTIVFIADGFNRFPDANPLLWKHALSFCVSEMFRSVYVNQGTSRRWITLFVHDLEIIPWRPDPQFRVRGYGIVESDGVTGELSDFYLP
jgi:hypothetical protein